MVVHCRFVETLDTTYFDVTFVQTGSIALSIAAILFACVVVSAFYFKISFDLLLTICNVYIT